MAKDHEGWLSTWQKNTEALGKKSPEAAALGLGMALIGDSMIANREWLTDMLTSEMEQSKALRAEVDRLQWYVEFYHRWRSVLSWASMPEPE